MRERARGEGNSKNTNAQAGNGETTGIPEMNVSKTPRGATKTSSLTGGKAEIQKAEF
jgi:hypothetical protein